MFKCINGCSECCGVVPIYESIFNKHQNKITEKIQKIIPFNNDEIIPITTDCKCVFLDRRNNLCIIYDDRPKVCRDYGFVEGLFCPYLKSNGNKRSDNQRKQIMRELNKKILTITKRC